jgi:cyclic pyranopterin phosphate synthase
MRPHDLLQRPLHDLRISVTDRCNFRCGYCMPAEVFHENYNFLPRSKILHFEEIERLAKIFVDLGVKKLRITGGEPLVRAQLPILIAKLRKIPGVEDIALTTNGVLLPQFADSLKDAGLDRLTVSLDSLDDSVYRQLNGKDTPVEQVLAGIKAAEAAGFTELKINAVVQRGVNDHTLLDLADHFRGTPHILRFIEFMDVGTMNEWDLSRVVPTKELIEKIDGKYPIEPADPNYKGEVAKRWRYKDGQGELGFITSVTEPFCGSCSRARLSSEGQLIPCLFASEGIDLKTPIRRGTNDDNLRALIAGAWEKRDDRYSELRTLDTPSYSDSDSKNKNKKLEMYHVGG